MERTFPEADWKHWRLRRSTAYRQLAAAVDLGLVTPEEFAGFSDETRALVAVLLGEK